MNITQVLDQAYSYNDSHMLYLLGPDTVDTHWMAAADMLSRGEEYFNEFYDVGHIYNCVGS